MTAEWMPDYPCDMGCVGCIGMPNPKCHAIIYYNGQIESQRKLLECLRAKYEMDDDYLTIPIETITSMLKQLEKGQ